MSRPVRPVPIVRARDLCKIFGGRGIVTIVVGEDDYAVTTYGVTREECRAMEQFSLELMEQVDNGTIDPWSGKDGSEDAS